MRRVLLAITVVMLAFTAAGCQRMVEVQTGVKVDCPYGHVDESDIQTIKVASRVASGYRVTTEKRVCDRHAALEKLYEEAQAALRAGDLKSAQAKLEQVEKQEEGFRKSADQLSALKEGKAPTPDGGGTPNTPAAPDPKPGEGDTSSPVGSLKGFVPDTLEGFTARSVITDPLVITRQYDPTRSSEIVLLTIVAEQFRTKSEANGALSTHMSRYPRGAQSVSDGDRSIRYGSDGRRFVTASFTEGAVLVILELGVEPGSDPARQKDTIIDAAKALP